MWALAHPGLGHLNEHSLLNDTEVNIVTLDPRLARDTRERLWAEHLEVAREQVNGDPTEVIDGLWRPIARSSWSPSSAARARLTA